MAVRQLADHFDDIEVQLIESPTSGNDYYPFGLAMEGRSWSSEPYRFGYQGQFSEFDEETGWNAFEARMYDPVIGRWLKPDMARQYFSSYLAMGNCPILYIDENGNVAWKALDWATLSTVGGVLEVVGGGSAIASGAGVSSWGWVSC